MPVPPRRRPSTAGVCGAWLVALTGAFVSPVSPWIGIAPCEEPIGTGEEISLEDRLRTGLRVRRPEDGAFIAAVIRRVNAGDLPRKLVDSTFIWAVRRRQKYPFPAFEQALRLQAERLGVDL